MSWPHLMVLLGTTAFALHSVRNVPLWALTGLAVVALHADAGWRGVGAKLAVWVRHAFANGATQARAGFWTLLAGLALALLALNGGRAAGLQLLPDRFDPGIFPLRLVERARAEGVSGRMYNELAWGGYILNKWPEQKVFIDGQTDFYGVPLSQLYLSLHQAQPGWKTRLDSLGVTAVIVPDDAPLAWALESSAGWSVADSANGAIRFAER